MNESTPCNPMLVILLRVWEDGQSTVERVTGPYTTREAAQWAGDAMHMEAEKEEEGADFELDFAELEAPLRRRAQSVAELPEVRPWSDIESRAHLHMVYRENAGLCSASDARSTANWAARSLRQLADGLMARVLNGYAS